MERVLVTDVVTYLEMTSADQLRPSRPAPETLEMRAQDSTSPLIRRTHIRIGAPHHWSTDTWSDERWAEQLSRPHQQHWIAAAGDEIVGLLTVQAQPVGEVEIVTFGLVPEFVGRGYGGHVLTSSVRLAWGVRPLSADRVRRVWLHTSSLDHPHALPNYQRRGFRPYRTEHKPREIPD